MTHRRAKIIYSLLVLLAFSLAGVSDVRADEETRAVLSSRGGRAAAVVAVVRERAVAHGISPWLLEALAVCESTMNPEAVGAAGELGLFQLASFGLLPAFYRMGFDDVWSPYQQSDFTAMMVAQGYGHHWSCYPVVRGW